MVTPRDAEHTSEKQVCESPSASGEAESRPALLEGAHLHEESVGTNQGEDVAYAQTQGTDVAKLSPLTSIDSSEASSSRSTEDAGEGLGLRRVREFIRKISPMEADEPSSGPSWQELQLEPTPTLLPNLR